MKGAFNPYLNRTTLNGVVHDSNFNDFDVRPYLKYSDTVGVWLEWYNTSAINKTVSFRPDGSTSDWRQDFSIFRASQYCYRYCPVPDDGIIEIYSDHADNVMYLRGEFGDGAVFNDNNPTSIEINDNGWLDIDISSRMEVADIGNAEAALLMIYYAALGKTQGFRKNGSTDDLQTVISPSDFVICGVDDNDIFEQHLLANTVHDIYYIGYVKKNSGVKWFTNYVQEYTTLTTNAWTELDITNASIPSDANYLICRLDTKLIDSGLRVRGIGSTIDESAINSGSATYRIDYVPIKNGKIEYYTDLSTSSIYSMGYGYNEPPDEFVGRKRIL